RRVHVEAERIRITLQELLGAFGHLVRVLRGVLAVDDEARLVALERRRADAAALLYRRCRFFQAARVLGNRAFLVAGLFRADGGERGADLLRLVGGNGGEGARRNRCDGERDERRRAAPRRSRTRSALREGKVTNSLAEHDVLLRKSS